MKENQDILLINDMPGFGKVALSAMVPVLSSNGYTISTLPTALVSNTLDYGLFEILDTTDYMEKTIEIWKKLGFHFDCVCTGFMVQEKQAELVRRVLADNPDAFVMVDPIMGDDGKLYNGITESTVECMRALIPLADVIVPNLTEAEMLVHGKVQPEKHGDAYFKDLLKALQEKGSRSVVITSAELDGKHYIYCASQDEIFRIEYEFIQARFAGTGDLFSSVLVGRLLKNQPLKQAVQAASDFVRLAIEENMANTDTFKGIRIEELIQKYGDRV